jgi:16S rRNA (adenine1518-N6/adenine1519-N6)-dimethyltransferase
MDIRALLSELGLRPRKRLGQNFLVDRHVLQQILTAAEIHPQDTVLEIGAGLGTLTQALAEHAARVIAVEVDEQLVAVLRSRLQMDPHIQIIQGDILALEITTLMQRQPGQGLIPYKVVANIPYYITSAVLRRLLEATAKPQLIVLMVQKEVAHRILATPGDMSLLAVSVQFYGQPRLMARVPARAFYPVPKVDSAIMRIDPHPNLPVGAEEIAPFFDTVRAGFGQRRKQLRNALAHGLGLPADNVVQRMHQVGIEARRRAETLSIAEWVSLFRALRSETSGTIATEGV